MIEEDDSSKLLYSRIDDKIKLSKTKNKILYTDFLNNIEIIFSVIRINLPNENKGKYTHKEYLGGMMKFGIDRRKLRRYYSRRYRSRYSNF